MTLPIVHLLHMSVKVELKHFTKNLFIKMTKSMQPHDTGNKIHN